MITLVCGGVVSGKPAIAAALLPYTAHPRLLTYITLDTTLPYIETESIQ